MKDTIFENEFLIIANEAPNYPFLHIKKEGTIIVPTHEDKIGLVKRDRIADGKVLTSGYEFPRGFGKSYKEVKAFLPYNEYVVSSSSLGTVQPDTGLMDNEAFIVQVEFSEEVEGLVWMDQMEFYSVVPQIRCGYTLAAALRYFAK